MDKLMKLNKEMYHSVAKNAWKTIQWLEGDDRKKMLDQLRCELVNLSSLEEQVKCADQIKNNITNAYNANEVTEEEKSNLLEEYKKQISHITPDMSSNKNVSEFDRIVSALENDADDKDGADEEDGDTELQLTRNNVNIIDPITKKRMNDPVRNKICGHVYDRESVEALINVNASTRCPVPGCKFKECLIMSNMDEDIVTMSYLQKRPA